MEGRGGGGGVLVVEDDCLIADHFARIIGRAEIAVAGIAEGAEAARQIAAATRPAAAVVDIRLGREDGIALARELQARHGTRIVFVTGSGEIETRRRAEAIGPVGFLQKPVAPVVLLQLVRAALG